LRTRLVAFNASVEAKRAGEAGRSFGVVADAVKDLAAKVEASSKEIMSTVNHLDARIDVLSRELRPPTKGQSSGAFHSALADVQASVGDIGESARHSMQISTELDERMREIGAKIERTDSALQTAVRRSGSFLTVSEKLVEIAVDNGIQTGDTPYIDACMKGARQIADDGQLILIRSQRREGRRELEACSLSLRNPVVHDRAVGEVDEAQSLGGGCSGGERGMHRVKKWKRDCGGEPFKKGATVQRAFPDKHSVPRVSFPLTSYASERARYGPHPL